VFQDLSTGRRIGCRSAYSGFTVALVLGSSFSTKMQSVIPVESYISSLGCKSLSCELGKHHRATFQSRVNVVVILLLSWSTLIFGVLVVCPLLSVLDIFCSLLITSLA